MGLRVVHVRLLAVLRGEVLGERTLLVAHRLQASDALLLEVLDGLLSRGHVGWVGRREHLLARLVPVEVLGLTVGAQAVCLLVHVLMPVLELGLLIADVLEDVKRRV